MIKSSLPTFSPQILSVGCATPETSYTQSEVASIMGVTNEKAMRFFNHPHIKTRSLLMPLQTQLNSGEIKKRIEETPAQLREKFLNHSLQLIELALKKALDKISQNVESIEYIACVTSTGFVVPGLSALVIEKLHLKNHCTRLDIVGMGCNAGLNGLQAVNNWCQSHPEKIAVLVCCELCSCIYSMEDNENAAIVNSLFGDGVAVCVMKSTETPNNILASIVDFQSHIIPNSLPYLRFNWNDEKNRHSFYVDKKTPETLAKDIETPLNSMLKRNQLKISDVDHWIVHSGGSAILDAIEKKVGLNTDAFKHTRIILENYGNISSGSFLFTFERLLEENKVKSGDIGLMMTMGPGLTIEMALIRW